MKKLSIDEVMDQIAKHYYHRDITPEDITTRRLSIRKGITIKKARLSLERAVEDGVLKKELVFDTESRKIVSAYSPTGKKIPESKKRP